MTSRTISFVSSLTVMAIGCIGMTGQALDLQALREFGLGNVEMRANTAFCFILTGISLLILLFRGHRRIHLLAQVALAAVIVLCTLTLLQYLTGKNFGIDEMLIRHTGGCISGSRTHGTEYRRLFRHLMHILAGFYIFLTAAA